MLYLIYANDPESLDRLLYGEPDPFAALMEPRYIDYDGDGNISFDEIIHYVVQQTLEGNAPYQGAPDDDIVIFGPDAATEDERDRYFAGERDNDPIANYDDDFDSGASRTEPSETAADVGLAQPELRSSLESGDGPELGRESAREDDAREDDAGEERRPPEEEEALIRRLREAGVSEAAIAAFAAEYRRPEGRARLLRNVAAARSARQEAGLTPASILLGAAAPDKVVRLDTDGDGQTDIARTVMSFDDAAQRYEAAKAKMVAHSSGEDDDPSVTWMREYRRLIDQKDNALWALWLADAARKDEAEGDDRHVRSVLRRERDAIEHAERVDRKDDDGGGGGGGREYTVADDGTVSYTQDDHTYAVSDDDLARDVREAAASGDASGLSSVDQVTVSTGDVGPVAADYNIGRETAGGSYGDLRAAQETWFREQLANLPDDPAEAAARLAELSARADELNAEWQGRDATFVGPDGQPITGAEYFAQVSASLSAGADENAVIADRNAALPDAVAPVTTTFQPNAGLGDRFNADRSAIDARVAAANAIEDPAERAEALAALATDIRGLQEQWSGTDTQGWTLGVDHDNNPDTPRAPTTAPEWWGDYAAGIETTAAANRSAAEHTAASDAAVADFNSASSGGPRSPADYARLAEEWRNRPDNELVQIAIDDPALAEAGGVVYQTPSGYFARLSGDPNIIAAEEQRERERRILPGETGGIGTQVAIDPVTGTLQVSRGVMPLVQAQIKERERQERTLPGETGGIGTQALAIDPVTGTPQVSSGSMALVQAHQEEQERQQRFLPGETGGIGTQVAVDPVTGTLQVSSGVAPIVQAQKEERERQQRFLPGETGRIGTQVAVDPVTGTLQVSSGVANALAAEAEQREIMGEGTLQVIRGDLNEPITVEEAVRAIARIKGSSDSASTLNPFTSAATDDPDAVGARQERLQRAVANGDLATLDEIRSTFPSLSEEEAKQQVVMQAVLDVHADVDLSAGGIGSQQLAAELRRRGFGPIDSQRWSRWANGNGLMNYSDLYAVAGAVVGGFAGRYAGRWVPILTTRVNPRLTTGVVRGFVEESGEEVGEIIAEMIATTAKGGNPLGALTDPATYAYAGGSILFSGVTEADNPNARPRPEAVPVGEEGTGAVFSTTGEPVDPARVAEGNRLLDRWAAANYALQNDPEDAPPRADQATWYRRREAIRRDVAQSGDALTTFRADHPDLVVGYKAGGVNVVASDNSLFTMSPDGQATLYAFQPGDAAFMMTSGGPDARTTYRIDESGNLVPVSSIAGAAGSEVSPALRSGAGSDRGVLPGTNTGSDSADDADSPLSGGRPPDTEDGPTATPAPPSQVAPVPTAALSEPLPLGQAEPAPQTTTPTPTETKGQGDSRDGRSAPPDVRDPGGPSFTPPPSPQPSSAAQASPAPQPTPQPSPSPSPRITPTPNPDPGRGTQSQPGPGSPQGGTPGTLTQQTAPGTSPLTQPGPAPATQPIPVPTVGPQPFGTPSAVGQPTASDPTPANIPDVTPTPTPTTETQPGTQPQPEPSITPTITTTETPNITPRPRPRPRRRRGDDETPRRREIPNPVADDPNRHPREVQFIEPVRHTVDLVTGEHTIEPLTDEQLRTARVTGFSPENPEGNVHRAGSLLIEPNEKVIALESAIRRRDANLQNPDPSAEIMQTEDQAQYEAGMAAFHDAYRQTVGQEPTGDVDLDEATYNAVYDRKLAMFQDDYRQTVGREPSGDVERDKVDYYAAKAARATATRVASNRAAGAQTGSKVIRPKPGAFATPSSGAPASTVLRPKPGYYGTPSSGGAIRPKQPQAAGSKITPKVGASGASGAPGSKGYPAQAGRLSEAGESQGRHSRRWWKTATGRRATSPGG